MNAGGPIAMTALEQQPDRPLLRKAVEVAHRIMRGVGTPPDQLGAGDIAVHLRRALTPKEIAKLTPEWLAIEAVHVAGHVRPILGL